MDLKYILIFVYALDCAFAKNKKSGKVTVVLSVFVKKNIKNEDTIIYNEGDNIDIHCELPNFSKANDDILFVDHQRVGLNTTTLESTNKSVIKYKITAEEVDDKSLIFCGVKNKSNIIKKNYTRKFTMNRSGPQSSHSINEIKYDEDNPMRVTCNKGDTLIQNANKTYVSWNDEIILSSSDDSSVIFCENINYKCREKYVMFKRKFYNGTIYKLTELQRYNSTNTPGIEEVSGVVNPKIQEIDPTTDQPAKTDEFSNQRTPFIAWKNPCIIGGSVAVVFIILVSILLLLRKKSKKKPPLEVTSDPKYENIELIAASNQIIYAELQLPEKPSNTHRFQDINEPQYAQIENILHNNDNK